MALELIEDQTRGGYSRIADEVRRNLGKFQHLTRVTISQNAPEWRRAALVTQGTGLEGVKTILLYDTNCYTEVWYKTGTKGHRAKVWVR